MKKKNPASACLRRLLEIFKQMRWCNSKNCCGFVVDEFSRLLHTMKSQGCRSRFLIDQMSGSQFPQKASSKRIEHV